MGGSNGRGEESEEISNIYTHIYVKPSLKIKPKKRTLYLKIYTVQQQFVAIWGYIKLTKNLAIQLH